MTSATIPPEDLERLVKLLALTASQHDGEALAAIRRANAVLDRLQIHWVELIDALAKERTVIVEVERERVTQADRIDDAFDLVLSTATGSFRDFIIDLLDQWRAKGSLSPKQLAALLRSEKRHRSAMQDAF